MITGLIEWLEENVGEFEGSELQGTLSYVQMMADSAETREMFETLEQEAAEIIGEIESEFGVVVQIDNVPDPIGRMLDSQDTGFIPGWDNNVFAQETEIDF